MKNITIRQMRYLDALARTGHFGRAAEACAVSQPALSMQIRELEAEAGGPLFERRAKGVTPTALGARLTGRVREILRAVDELQDMARAGADSLSGEVRLGVIPTVAPYLRPRVISALGRERPTLDLNIRETITPRLIDALEDGSLDAAIIALPVQEGWLTSYPLLDETFVLVRPRAQEGQPVPSHEGLTEMRLLLLEEGHCFRDQALSFCALAPSKPREIMDGSSLSTLVQMVSAGIGVTLIPEMAAPVETRSADVVLQDFPAPAPARKLGLVWRKTSPLSKQFQELGRIIAEAARAT